MTALLSYLGIGSGGAGASGAAGGAAGTGASATGYANLGQGFTAGAGQSPAFTSAAAQSPAAGASTFGGGFSGGSGTAGLPALTAQPGSLPVPPPSFGARAGQFGLGVLNPPGGQAGQSVFAAGQAGKAPAFGDVATYIIQELLNSELRKSAGPAFTPLSNLVQNRFHRYMPAPGDQRRP